MVRRKKGKRLKMARGNANLQEVPTVEVETEDTNQGVQAGNGQTSTDAGDNDADKPAFAFVTYDDLPDDLPEPRTRSAVINWGFKEMPVKAATVIPKDLADRARSAAQNARFTKGKANGKMFITRQAVEVLTAKRDENGNVLMNGTQPIKVRRYPDAKKGDIEIIRTA
jgi:hypothetical protein